MRILHILDHSLPLHSGYSFRTREILDQQRARGWETAQVTGTKQSGAREPVEVADGLTFHRTLSRGGLGERVPVLNQWVGVRALARRITSLLPTLRPEILHAHSPCLNGMAALSVGRRFGLPVLYEMRALWEDAAVDHGTATEGGLRYRLSRFLETRVLRRADAITTICEGLRAEVLARGIPGGKVTVIPNAVDIERFTVAERPDDALRRELGLEGARVLGFLGSFYAYEGLSLLLEAFPGILAAVPSARLLLVGGGYEEEALRRQAAQAGIADKVLFPGRVPHDRVQAYYSLVDLLVYPRLSMRLTELVTPLKPLEGMAQGKLVVASDVGGHRELIRDGETGVLFRAGDAASLSAAVRAILLRPEQQAAILRAGRRFVENERNWAASVARYEPVYASLLGRSTRASA
ncbi:MAG: TIGR04063 family PEP-CTERM/XrtA system glycosyltransferase [Planctomycetaceae bacterium]